MLSLQAAESAHVTTETLDSKGIAIVAKPDSLLSGLVATTYIDFDPAVQGGEYFHNINHMCAMTDSSSSATGFSEHTARMEELSDVLAEKVTKHLFFTRTVVAPFVDAYAARLRSAMELISGNPDNGIEVIVNSRPGPLEEPTLVDSILRSQEVIYQRPPLNCDLPAQDDNQIRALMQTGSASVDAAINEYFGNKPEGWLASNWKTIFMRAPIGEPVPNGLDQLISGKQYVDVALFVFLVSRRLWNAPLDGTNMSSAAYEDTMVTFRNQSALRLCHELERQERDGQEGILVLGIDRTVVGSQKVLVNANVYREFLKAGGTNEILLGNALQTQTTTRVEDLMAKKELFEAAWQRHYAYNNSYYEQKRLLQMRDILSIEWEALMREYTPEDFPLHERASSNAMIKRLAQATTAKDFDDLNDLAMTLTCKARFYKTDAYDILKGIARARQTNPSLSPSEAATISVTEYVCRWIGKQLMPVTANKVEVFTSQDTRLA